jgi:uncharacterized protein YbjT (DUF2867 family)
VDIFDRLHEQFFDLFFGLDEASRQELAHFARECGAGDEQVRQIQAGGVYAGLTLGGARAADVGRVVERVLFRQGAAGVTLRVARPPFDEAGHVEIRIIEVEPPPDPPGPSGEVGPAPQTSGEDTP